MLGWWPGLYQDKSWKMAPQKELIPVNSHDNAPQPTSYTLSTSSSTWKVFSPSWLRNRWKKASSLVLWCPQCAEALRWSLACGKAVWTQSNLEQVSVVLCSRVPGAPVKLTKLPLCSSGQKDSQCGARHQIHMWLARWADIKNQSSI